MKLTEMICLVPERLIFDNTLSYCARIVLIGLLVNRRDVTIKNIKELFPALGWLETKQIMIELQPNIVQLYRSILFPGGNFDADNHS